MTLGLMVAGVVVCMLLRVPVAIALLLPSLIYLIISPGLTIDVALQQVTSGIDSFILLAVPLFVLAGNMMNVTGITDRIFHFAQTILGRVRGSLGYVNISASILFAGMSGSAIVDAAGLGGIEVNAMRKQGYDDKFSVGITAASSTIGPIIPPSIPAVIYGAAASVSIGGLFVAGILPGLLMALALAILVYIYSKRRDYPRAGRATLREIGRVTVAAFPALLTPAIILGGIISGFFTPTEAAGVTVIYAAVISMVLYRSLRPKGLYRALVSTAETTASILLIVGAASLFGYVLTREQAPQVLANAFLGITDNTIVFLLLINILLFLVGMVLEPVAALLIMIPVLLPIIQVFDIDPLHFGVIMILNLMIGLLTPPVGLVLYVLASVTGIPFHRVVQGTVPFLIPLIITLLLVTYIPSISLFLPRLLGF